MCKENEVNKEERQASCMFISWVIIAVIITIGLIAIGLVLTRHFGL